MILDSGKTEALQNWKGDWFESVVILDSGKTDDLRTAGDSPFESAVILDSGKTKTEDYAPDLLFESVVIRDKFSKRGQNLWRLLPPFFCIPRAFSVLDSG